MDFWLRVVIAEWGEGSSEQGRKKRSTKAHAAVRRIRQAHRPQAHRPLDKSSPNVRSLTADG
ncbi:MAG: hypothetical protein DWQ51_13385 [Microcystis wesenbergii TW10]|uniref:Uncharacterized protein n=1 Tax=Microcystis wesenbergii TW10 TaxID=2060474 RepID=A0A3E0LVT8_9CHRO|nr:MAG: hypothetical protein DWQ51_13385 [Microcystis wesenbergii TW10]